MLVLISNLKLTIALLKINYTCRNFTLLTNNHSSCFPNSHCLCVLLFLLQEHVSHSTFYRSPAGPPIPRSPISALPPCYPERGAAVTCSARSQPGVGQRALHEPAAEAQSQPHTSTLVPAGDAPGKVTCKPPVTTIKNSEESPWRRRSSFEPHMPEHPLDLDDADLPVSEVWAVELDIKTWNLDQMKRETGVLKRAGIGFQTKAVGGWRLTTSQTWSFELLRQCGQCAREKKFGHHWTALVCQRRPDLHPHRSACLPSHLQSCIYFPRVDVVKLILVNLCWLEFSDKALF